MNNEALADQLSACADAIHARTLQAIKSYGGAPVSDADQQTFRAMLGHEMILRERANALYADAAAELAAAVAPSAARLTALTRQAADKLRTIGRIGQAVDLSAALAGVAGAIACGQAPVLLKALEQLYHSLQTPGA